MAAFIGFSLIPTVLLAFVASGLVNKAVDVWFSDQIEQVMRDSYEVAKMQHAGHITLAVNSARAISHEIFREDMLLPEQRDLLVAAMARKRAEFGVAGIEVFSAKDGDAHQGAGSRGARIGSRSADRTTRPPGDQWEAGSERGAGSADGEAWCGRPPPWRQADGAVRSGVWSWWMPMCPNRCSPRWKASATSTNEYKQIKAMKNPIKAGAYLFVAVITLLILFGATWFGFYVARSITVPIQRLAEATDAIAQGDLSVRIQAKATDEIGTLIDSFNRMTSDLQGSKSDHRGGQHLLAPQQSRTRPPPRLY